MMTSVGIRTVNEYLDIRISDRIDNPIFKTRRQISVHMNNFSTTTTKIFWLSCSCQLSPATLYAGDLWLSINRQLLHTGCMCQLSVQKNMNNYVACACLPESQYQRIRQAVAV